ncbi:hypothetical protein [Neorhodopirellula pilleata]|uniref:Uncharacterized protein n=1 Tax=Neorhodopirellula pilleata TaxID=2714738 RepID=A0A5C6A6N3_9BACT|nr:hypothetical protein [Neorhodopirellula pilleata]TWT95106.1 hypothetical protein Pla100_36880 [Neorhodopirellula pilleata]
MNWIRTLRQKWDDWCGDHEMENSIRKHLTQNGYFGSSAKFQAVRLVAVQRPGWLQLYRFEVTARVDPQVPDNAPTPEPEYRQLFGLVREDYRHNQSNVRVFTDEHERKALFLQWSDGLICLRGAKGLVSS